MNDLINWPWKDWVKINIIYPKSQTQKNLPWIKTSGKQKSKPSTRAPESLSDMLLSILKPTTTLPCASIKNWSSKVSGFFIYYVARFFFRVFWSSNKTLVIVFLVWKFLLILSSCSSLHITNLYIKGKNVGIGNNE